MNEGLVLIADASRPGFPARLTTRGHYAETYFIQVGNFSDVLVGITKGEALYRFSVLLREIKR